MRAGGRAPRCAGLAGGADRGRRDAGRDRLGGLVPGPGAGSARAAGLRLVALLADRVAVDVVADRAVTARRLRLLLGDRGVRGGRERAGEHEAGADGENADAHPCSFGWWWSATGPGVSALLRFVKTLPAGRLFR